MKWLGTREAVEVAHSSLCRCFHNPDQPVENSTTFGTVDNLVVGLDHPRHRLNDGGQGTQPS
jgi:hypothetical protein